MFCCKVLGRDTLSVGDYPLFSLGSMTSWDNGEQLQSGNNSSYQQIAKVMF
jgi:hypothetical protein